MKAFVKAMALLCVAALTLAANCRHDPPNPPGPEPPGPGPDPAVVIDETFSVSCNGSILTLTVTVAESWTASVAQGVDWCVLESSSGGAGEGTIKATVSPNTGFEDRDCYIYIAFDSNSAGKIHVIQARQEVLSAAPSAVEATSDGGEFSITLTANIEYAVTASDDWLGWTDAAAGSDGALERACTLTVAENPAEEPRSGTVILSGNGLSQTISVTQAGAQDVTDPLDGIVTTLQTHGEGAGIPLILMGDAFTHDDIDSGLYLSLMTRAAEAFFSEEPYSSYRQLFDVYVVNVASEPYTDFSSGSSTTLGSWFGEGTHVGADLSACRKYALKAIGGEDLDKSLTVVLLNRQYHAGRCYMSFVHREDAPGGDCARGEAYALMALGDDDQDFATLVIHEAGGHGFGKLADEYCYEGMGSIPQQEAEMYRSLQTLSRAYMNVSFSAEELPWQHFLEDGRYAADGLGTFEGGCLYEHGVWRASENSVMNYAPRGFNAPGREAIWLRLGKLAYGSEWEYDWEDFVAYDAVNREDPEPEPGGGDTATQTASERKKMSRAPFRAPCPPPVILSY